MKYPVICPECGSQATCEGHSNTGPSTWIEGWVCLGDCGSRFEIERYNGDLECEPEDLPLFDTDGWSAKEKGRLTKCLDRRYNFFDGGVMSLGQWLEGRTLTHKTRRIREYASKKRHLCYEKLKNPTTEYSVWTGRTGIPVPKLVWDALTTPEREANR